MNELINVKNENGKLLVSSREIAEHFGKEHRIVCRDIENLNVQNCTLKNMFIESQYISDRGRTYREYLMDRDGFSLLVMGFTGQKALEWKLKYIEAFNKMEESLKNGIKLSLEQKAQLMLFSDNLEERAEGSRILQNIAVEKATKPLLETIENKQTIIDNVIDDKSLFAIGTVGKILKPYIKDMGAIKIFKFLRDNGILMDAEGTQRHNLPYDKYNKHFEMKCVESNFGTHTKTYFNGSGLKWFLNKLAKDGYLTSEQKEEIKSKF